MGYYLQDDTDLSVIARALYSHEVALKQSLVEHNRAIAEKRKRPYRPVEDYVVRRILSPQALTIIEDEISRTSLLRLKLDGA